MKLVLKRASEGFEFQVNFTCAVKAPAVTFSPKVQNMVTGII